MELELDLFLGMGDACYRDREFTEAIEHYSKALFISEIFNKQDVEYVIREKIARAYYSANKNHEALRHLCLLSICPQLVEESLIKVLSLKGICQIKIGRFDEALETFNSLNSFESPLAKRKFHFNLASLHMLRGKSLSDMGDLDLSIEHFQTAKTYANDDLMLYKINKNLGIVFNLKGNFRESLDFFAKAIALANNHEILLCNAYQEYAYSLLNIGDFDRATELLNYCLNISAKYNDYYLFGYTYMQFGLLNFGLGLDDEGENQFFEAIRYLLLNDNYYEIADSYNYLYKYFVDKNPEAANWYLQQKRLFEEKNSAS